MTRRAQFGRYLILLPPVAGLLAFVFVSPIPQNETYHSFVDRRTILGIPNFWNVISNLPFAVAGIAGLLAFRDAASRLLFAGILLTTFGSAYYHWEPTTAHLVWDRLPMTIAFMSMLALILGFSYGEEVGRRLLLPLVAVGLASVLWWYVDGDLRLYALVQFGSIAMILIALVCFEVPAAGELWIALLLYALAKVAEAGDRQIYGAIPLSGHTIKHLLAGLSTWWIYRWRHHG